MAKKKDRKSSRAAETRTPSRVKGGSRSSPRTSRNSKPESSRTSKSDDSSAAIPELFRLSKLPDGKLSIGLSPYFVTEVLPIALTNRAKFYRDAELKFIAAKLDELARALRSCRSGVTING